MIRKIAAISFYVLLPLGVMILLGFAVENNQSMPCRSFQVKINTPAGISFVDTTAVIKQVNSVIGPVKGNTLNAVPIARIEELVNSIYYVDQSRVYRTIDGHVIADIDQRVPVARVINSMNEHFYIDTRGKLMRTSNRYSARVIVVSGFINTRYSPAIDISQYNEDDDLTASERVLFELDKLIRYIMQDDFLHAWIDQIYVNRLGEFELVPRNGVHTIEFGNTENMESKFNKLLFFYKNGLTHLGWGYYKRINLKFKNQVVCSK
jgi:cell division protein FtsQ